MYKYKKVYVCTYGQTESKKISKKHGSNGGNIGGNGIGGIIETKGTAMSFGFRKKLNTTPKKLKKLIEGDTKKKQDKCNNPREGTTTDTIGESKKRNVIDDEISNKTIVEKDNNGNADILPKVRFEKMGAAAATNTTKQALKSTKFQGVTEQVPVNRTGVSNRFGYRGTNIVRPSSAGITPQYQGDVYDNVANNNYTNAQNPSGQKVLISNLKRRSKSAHAGRASTLNQSVEEEESIATAAPKITHPKTITFNLNQNSTIEYQRRQFFEEPITRTSVRQPLNHEHFINTGMHTNVIVRPTPRAPPATYSKFTLQTVSLPKPEFPVAISLSATTPTTPGSSYTPSPTAATPKTTTMAAGGLRTKSSHLLQHQYQQQHPLTIAQSSQHQNQPIDLKMAKQMANNTRRGFNGSREISADSGIASMDMALDSSASSTAGSNGHSTHKNSPKRSRSRPRNLQMIMNGRHKFEVRDLDDPPSSESSSLVEPLALPKLPAENQTIPLPLSGLVRSNTILSREVYENRNAAAERIEKANKTTENNSTLRYEISRNIMDESDSIGEEKLYIDRSTSEKCAKKQEFRDINTCSSKTSSPGSSIMLSWCNAGESLAIKDCSSFSISSNEDSNKLQEKIKDEYKQLDLVDDDISLLNTDMQVSTISSITEALPVAQTYSIDDEASNTDLTDNVTKDIESYQSITHERPKSLYNSLNETKFAEMVLEGSTFLLDDETSPTDSLVSSTESEDADCKEKKHKLNEELQEKDIDEISPELEAVSPISPGSPTHASRSLSLSDCGNLIDDEIADQPALLFNTDAADNSGTSRRDKTDTPTLMESISLRSMKSQTKTRTVLQQAIELSLRTPLSMRKVVLNRTESMDTLSPCESICSDDLMMDFDINSSMDSIRSASIKSRSGSDINKLDENELFCELERKGSGVMKDLNSLLRTSSIRNTEKDSIIAHLPARATRLLNRSRLQQQCPLNSSADSDTNSLRRSAAASRASTASNASPSLHRKQHFNQQQQQQHQQQHHHLHQRDSLSSSDDLMLYDKSFRNAMIQDVLQFKKQLLRLRRILQENEDCLTRTETLNPFENDNGQLFATCGLDSKLLDDIDLASLTSSTTDDPMQELADLRRQVVYLQGQVEDRERTIRLQRNHIEKLEADKDAPLVLKTETTKECINTATQTERTRPLSLGPEGLSRSKPEYTSYTTTHFPMLHNDTTTVIQQHYQQPMSQNVVNTTNTRRHTIISTTLTNYNHQLANYAPRRASIAWEQTPQTTMGANCNSMVEPLINSTNTTTATKIIPTTYKPVRITLIGDPLKQQPPVTTRSKNFDSTTSQQNGSYERSRSQIFDNKTNGNEKQDCKNSLNSTSNILGTVVSGMKNSIGKEVINNNKDKLFYNGIQTAFEQQHHQQQQQQHQQSQQLYAKHLTSNGKLNPTVTIV